MHFVGTLSRNSSPKKGQQSEPLCCRLIPFKLLFTVILPITWTYGAALCSWQQFFMLAPFANSYLFQYLFLWHGSRSLCGREGLSEENSLSLALSPSLSLSLAAVFWVRALAYRIGISSHSADMEWFLGQIFSSSPVLPKPVEVCLRGRRPGVAGLSGLVAHVHYEQWPCRPGDGG